MRRHQVASDFDPDLLVRDASLLLPDPARRQFLKGSLSVGSLALLTGCSILDSDTAENALRVVSEFNDRVQAALFDPNRLAQEYTPADITRPFPFNAFYKEDKAPEIDAADWTLEVDGDVADKTPWTLDKLAALPQASQITRHICIEGWSAVGQWSGVPLALFLKRIGADTRRKYVAFKCEDGYSTSLDMATALHPQTQITLQFAGETLPRKYGFPIKIRVPTKLGFKNPKHVTDLIVTDDYADGFWEKYGYNWFSGL